MNNYKHDALLRIKSQLDFGYLDIDKDYDEVEFDVINEAIKEYESNHILKEENNEDWKDICLS